MRAALHYMSEQCCAKDVTLDGNSDADSITDAAAYAGADVLRVCGERNLKGVLTHTRACARTHTHTHTHTHAYTYTS